MSLVGNKYLLKNNTSSNFLSSSNSLNSLNSSNSSSLSNSKIYQNTSSYFSPENFHKTTFANLLTIYPLIMLFFGIFYSIIELNIFGIIFAICLILCSLANSGIKKGLSLLLGEEIVKRPKGNRNYTCGYFEKQLVFDEKESTGMPSGHAQSSFFIFIFMLFFLYDRYRYSSSYKKVLAIIGVIIFMLLAFIVSIQRTLIVCHTPMQVFVGALIGSILAVLLYFLVAKQIIYYATSDEEYRKIFNTTKS